MSSADRCNFPATKYSVTTEGSCSLEPEVDRRHGRRQANPLLGDPIFDGVGTALLIPPVYILTKMLLSFLLVAVPPRRDRPREAVAWGIAVSSPRRMDPASLKKVSWVAIRRSRIMD